MPLPPSGDTVNHMRRSVTTTGVQAEVGPVVDLTLELTPAKVQVRGNGGRASLSYLLGGDNATVRQP